MSRRQIDMQMSSQMLKLAESNVHTELSRFLKFQHMATRLDANPTLIEIGPKNLERDGRTDGRPAGHTLQNFIVMGNLRLQ